MDNIQESIVSAIESIAKDVIEKSQYTRSYVGKVESVAKNGETIVKVNEHEWKCQTPANMFKYISKGDMVVVQDLHNNSAYKVVQGVLKGTIGTDGATREFRVFSEDTNEVISSVFRIYDNGTGNTVSRTLKA